MSNTTPHYDNVRKFMKLAGQSTPSRVTNLSADEILLRARLIYEEAMETIYDGLGVDITFNLDSPDENPQPTFTIVKPVDYIETIDGCCDLKVVTTGTLVAMGVPDIPFQEEVDRNNLDKFGEGGHRDETGKWIKPPNHQPPKIKDLLDECIINSCLTPTEDL